VQLDRGQQESAHISCAADKSHPRTHEIYAELERLVNELKTARYVPDSCLVTRDVHIEQQKGGISLLPQ
jgi:hypothetical protein